MPECSLPGCTKPVAVKPVWSTGEQYKRYCGLRHAAYHERDKETAEWLRKRHHEQEARAHRHGYTNLHDWDDAAAAIEQGEHHRG